VSVSIGAPHLAMPRPPSRSWQAFASALGIEAALLGIAMAWLVTHPSQPAEKVVPITIEQVLEPVVQKPVEPEPEKIVPPKPVVRPLPVPVPAAKPVVQPPTPPMPQSAPAPTSVPAPNLIPSPVPVPDTVTQAPAPPAPLAPPTAYSVPVAPAPPPPAPPPPPPPMAATVDPSPAYNAKLAAAVQAVFEVPAAAAALNFKGRTRVEFSLRDGVVSAARVVQTSGLGAADRAALKAVQAAAYPAPPPALQGKENSYQIWVVCL
jgi:periplasmic protein TonB